MSASRIDRKFYDAIVNFAESEEAQDYYYEVMDSETGKVNRNGKKETIRDRVLKAYGLLFCEDTGLKVGENASVDDVADTADRLYIGEVGYDPDHWYRIKHNFHVIDEDNYDRFAALVIADLRCGNLHDLAQNERKMLIVGEADPLNMTMEQRQNQRVQVVSLPGGDI